MKRTNPWRKPIHSLRSTYCFMFAFGLIGFASGLLIMQTFEGAMQNLSGIATFAALIISSLLIFLGSYLSQRDNGKELTIG